MVSVTWRGSPNHYQGRNGYKVDHITLHIMVGGLWGTDTCFRDPDFKAASHYGVGADGTILQWVSEADGSWADANMASDCSGVTIEHAGGIAGIPVTDKEIEASAQLCADIARRYGWRKLYHDGLNGNIYLHREIPGTDHAGCPDRAADNPLPVQRILDRANQLLGAANTTTTTLDDLEDTIMAVKATHIIFQFGNALGIANTLANTYHLYTRSQDYKDNVYALKQAGMKVVTWGALRGKTGKDANKVDNPAAFGTAS